MTIRHILTFHKCEFLLVIIIGIAIGFCYAMTTKTIEKPVTLYQECVERLYSSCINSQSDNSYIPVTPFCIEFMEKNKQIRCGHFNLLNEVGV